MKKYNKVFVGGTFDRLHKGHKHLIKKAFQLSEKVVILIADDKYARGKARGVKSRKIREKHLRKWLSDESLLKRTTIVTPDDWYGPSIIDYDLEATITTPDYRPKYEEVNDIRRKRRLKQLKIITVEKMLAENGKPISSTRIRAGEINAEGKIPKCQKGENRLRI